MLGSGTAALAANDRSLGSEILGVVGAYAQSQDPRVRHASFVALLALHSKGFALDTATLYPQFCTGTTHADSSDSTHSFSRFF